MNIQKAVITAAGRSQRGLPLQTLVDRDGSAKSALQVIIEEVLAAGVEQIAVVVAPGDQAAYAAAAGSRAGLLQFIEQSQPRGYGHALHCAAKFVGSSPFLHLISDHVYLSSTQTRCAQQLVAVASAAACSVSAVQPTRENMLPYYGAVGGRRVPNQPSLYEIETVLEKPTPTEAEQKLIVPGLRAGYYLCFFGMHVLTATVMDLLALQLDRPGTVQLSPALAQLAAKERYLALELHGQRHNIGVKYGLLTTQLALALAGDDRDEVLSNLVELLATRTHAEA